MATKTFVYGTHEFEVLQGRYPDSTSDVVFGYGGDDTIFGEGYDDFLFGGDGNDTLHGGHGADLLHGGADFGHGQLHFSRLRGPERGHRRLEDRRRLLAAMPRATSSLVSRTSKARRGMTP